jgi:hypothetical protein
MLASIWKKYSFVIIFVILSFAMGITVINSWEEEEGSAETVRTMDGDHHSQYEMTMNQNDQAHHWEQRR